MVMKNFRAEDMPLGKDPSETVVPNKLVSGNPLKGSDVHESEKKGSTAKLSSAPKETTEGGSPTGTTEASSPKETTVSTEKKTPATRKAAPAPKKETSAADMKQAEKAAATTAASVEPMPNTGEMSSAGPNNEGAK